MYAIEVYDGLVFPKYAKVIFKINPSGNLTMHASPALTPGKEPPGTVRGKVPKGTKVFDYSKEIIASLEFEDCLNIINFAKNRNHPNPDVRIGNTHYTIFRNSERFNKKINFTYTMDDNDPTVAKMATIWFESVTTAGEIKFYLPMSLNSFDNIAEICKSYCTNITNIKLSCALYNEIEKLGEASQTNKGPSVTKKYADNIINNITSE